ncbi:hypothetical protein AB1Y20_011591 [Prymnesium parvum]|uniref:Transmembrane protein n=1 Tax=Prymnesium parvum TaxID=97485 RepID=A0AB34IJ10_PRYPA
MCDQPSHAATLPWVRLVVLAELALFGVLGLAYFIRSTRAAKTPPFLDVAATAWCTGAGGTHNRRRQRALLAWRAAALLWAIGVLSRFYLPHGTPLGWNLSFYTVWNYHLQLLDWACAVAASACWLLHPDGAPSSAAASALKHLTLCLCELCTPASVLVSILLWGVLFPHAAAHGDYSDLSFNSFAMHAVNTVLLLVEFRVNRITVQRHHVLFILAWAMAYAIFAWVQHPFTHCWPYFFLSLTSAEAIFWYAAIAGLHVVVYAAACWLSSLKERRFAPLLEGGLSESNGNLTAVCMNNEEGP